MKRNPKAEAALQAILQAELDARNAGRDYYKQSPNEMLVEVSRRGSALYDKNSHIIAYLQGYSEARVGHDSYRRGE